MGTLALLVAEQKFLILLLPRDKEKDDEVDTEVAIGTGSHVVGYS